MAGLAPTVLTAILFAPGCASYEAQPLPARDVRMMINRYDKDGFVFSGRLFDSEDCKIYLDRNLLARDILPVAVYIANTLKDESSFQVRLKGISLRLADQTEFEQVPVREVLEDVRYSRWRSTPLWFLLIFPGAIAVSHINEANENMLQDYRSKAMEDVNVPAREGLTVNRLVFFRPKDKSLDECDLSKTILSTDVELRGPKSGRPFSATVTLDQN